MIAAIMGNDTLARRCWRKLCARLGAANAFPRLGNATRIFGILLIATGAAAAQNAPAGREMPKEYREIWEKSQSLKRGQSVRGGTAVIKESSRAWPTANV
jgi:hypothetical protein